METERNVLVRIRIVLRAKECVRQLCLIYESSSSFCFETAISQSPLFRPLATERPAARRPDPPGEPGDGSSYRGGSRAASYGANGLGKGRRQATIVSDR